MSSGERRFVGILETLAKKHEIELCVAQFGPWLLHDHFQVYLPPLEYKGIKISPIKPNNVKEVVKNGKYDIGIFEFYWIAEECMHLFMRYQPQAITIVDSVDVHFAREETQAKLGLIRQRKARRTKINELRIYKYSDISIAVSKEDFAILHDKEKVGAVSMVPNIVPSVNRIEKEREPIAIFIGSYEWPPNADAIKWFVEEIWPLVIKEVVNAKLQIIGSNPTEEIKSLSENNGIEVLGFVPSTEEFLDNAAVSIAPMRYGGGMKGKVNEALAHAVPVVATKIGAQGFDAINGVEMIIEDNPLKFAQSIVNLFNDQEKQKQIGVAGQELNEKLCSPTVVENYLDEMLDKAIKIKAAKSIKKRNSVIFNLWFNYFISRNLKRLFKLKKIFTLIS